MKYLKHLFIGIIFGIVLTKGEVISWYRIYEMFTFSSFHMYGVIGSSVLLGIIGIQFIKQRKIKAMPGGNLNLHQYNNNRWKQYLFGGSIFGIGWALTGACPGPLFILVGNGLSVMILAIVSAILGTFVYGVIREKLPH